LKNTDNDVVLAVRGVVKQYGDMRAVDDVSLDVYKGEILGLVGANGAGKSTVIGMVSGATVPDEGTITVDGVTLEHHTPSESLAAGVAVIYQEPHLIDHQTIAENIFFGHRKPGLGPVINWRKTEARAREILAGIGVAVDVSKPISEASLWEKWVASLGHALVAGPKLLILAEPTSALDHDGGEMLFAAVREMQKQGTAIIFVSHRLDEVLSLCSRVHIMRDARSVFDAPTSEITRDMLVHYISGPLDRPVEVSVEAGDLPDVAHRTMGEVMLDVDSLKLAHRRTPVSFSVRSGEILGLAGLVGSGRTSLLRALAGADRQATGSVIVDGRRMRLGSTARSRRRGFAFLPEDRIHQGIIDNLTIAAHMMIGRRTRAAKVPWWIGYASELETARTWIDSLRIRGAKATALMRTLSGGNQQKVLFARMIEHNPQVLLLDEPSRGVDVGSRRDIYAMVRQFAAEGMAVVVAISELDELVDVADRVVVLREGEAVAELSDADLTKSNIIAACF
jgi:ABC-type sugar transport system ATPase subunit